MGDETVQIVTDSAADLPPSFVEKLDITVVPLTVSHEGESFKDGELDPYEFIDRMRQSDELPVTSQPSPGDFATVFEELADSGPILCMLISSKLSGTLQSASMAADIVDADIELFDTLAATLAQGAQVLQAARLTKKGTNVEQIIEHLQQIRDNQRIFIAIPDLTNLVRGGRLSSLKGKVADFMDIKPILHNVEGEIQPYERVRGDERLFERVVDLVEEEAVDIENRIVGISHADDEERAKQLEKKIYKLGAKDVIVGPMYSVISTHAGPGGIVVGV